MTDFPQDIYARNLLSHRGYPLWTPEPGIGLPSIYLLEGLKIGDVGVVVPEEGSFDVFFNITLSREHLLHAADGVPNNFTQVKLRCEDYRIVHDAESPGRVISSPAVGCTVSCIDPFHLDGMAHRLTNHQFNLHQNEGAMLVLPQGAERHRLAKELLLLNVIIQNAVEWYRFAREQLYRDISNDALYLITGFHKTQSFSLASFKCPGASSAHCRIVQRRKAGPVLAVDSTWETAHPLEWRIGPRHSVAVPNQSAFITGFKIAVNEELLHLKRVTVKVGHSKRTLATKLVGLGASVVNLLLWTTFNVDYSPEAGSQDEETNESTAGHDSPDDEHERVRVDRVPQLLQPFHPSDIINRYMLKKVPSARIAVTHDSQWIALLERILILSYRGILSQQDILQEGRLEAVVAEEYTIITKDGAVFLQSIREPKDMSTTAATMFNHRGTSPLQHLHVHIPPPSWWFSSRPADQLDWGDLLLLYSVIPYLVIFCLLWRTKPVGVRRPHFSDLTMELKGIRKFLLTSLVVFISILLASRSMALEVVALTLFIYTISLHLASNARFIRYHPTLSRFLHIIPLLGTAGMASIAFLSNLKLPALSVVTLVLGVLPLVVLRRAWLGLSQFVIVEQK